MDVSGMGREGGISARLLQMRQTPTLCVFVCVCAKTSRTGTRVHTCQALECPVEDHVLAAAECGPQQVVLGAEAHDAVDGTHAAAQVVATWGVSLLKAHRGRQSRVGWSGVQR